MRNALIHILLLLPLAAIHAYGEDAVPAGGPAVQPADSIQIPQGKVIPMNGAFLQPLQERDSVLIADQLLYGFELKQVEEGTQFAFPQWQNNEKGGVQALSPWIVDTVKVTRQKKGLPRLLDLKAGLVVTSFDEGHYELPSITVGRLSKDGVMDTLVFDPIRLEVKTMPVDTASFVPHDIKGQIRYPVTFAEVAPWLAGGWAFATVIILVTCLVMMHRRRNSPENIRREPAHIVALRKLDRYRGSGMWVPEKQKAFYSGVTDALREYMAARYGIGAMEMTTSEIFAGMAESDVPEALLNDVRELFERADFVKFAKYVASEEDNASALPVAVRFVTETYQADIEDTADGQSGSLEETAPAVQDGTEASDNGGTE